MLFLGILFWILFNISSVKAGFLTYSGEVKIKIAHDFKVKAEIFLDIKNTATVAINADWLAVKLLDRHIKNANIVVAQNTPVGFYVLNDKDGAWLRVVEREGTHFVLNPGEHLKIYASGDVESPFSYVQGGVYIFNYPAEQENIKLKVMVDKSIALGSDYKFKLYKQTWRVFDFTDLDSDQLILFGKQRKTISFFYELISKYSYILPSASLPCTRMYLISPKPNYLYVDSTGVYFPSVVGTSYVSYLVKVVDVGCLHSINDSTFYAGFKWSVGEQVATPVIFKWSNGKVYFLVNGQFIPDKSDKYGIIYFPVRSCELLEQCFKAGGLEIGNLTLIESGDLKDYINLGSNCNLLNTEELAVNDLEYAEGVLFNKTNFCGKVSRISCGSINLLGNKHLILMPRGNFDTKCRKDTLGILKGLLKANSVLKYIKDGLKVLWLFFVFFTMLSFLRFLTCYNKKS